MSLREWALRRVTTIMASRPPDFEIGPPGDRYMLRWHLCPWSNYEKGTKPKNLLERFVRSLPAIYAHLILHDDEDRALHDHPFSSISYVLESGYWEVRFYPLHPKRIAELELAGMPRPMIKAFRPEGSITIRAAATAHRLVLEKTAGRLGRTDSKPAISLFFCGFRTREWGFWCPKGWKHWKDFVSARDRGAVGVGCGED